MRQKLAAGLICLLWLGLFGCARSEPAQHFAPLEVQVMAERPHCGQPAEMPNALWIAEKAHLKRIFDRVKRRQIGKSAPEWVESVDFKNYGILLVHMGRQPTGGYFLEYVPGHAHISQKTATIVLKWIMPDPDAMVTQVITNPCMMLKMPKAGFDRIAILDQNGRLKAAVDLGQPKSE